MSGIVLGTHNDPWYITESGFNIANEREIETIFSIGNGYIGTRNSLEEYYVFSNPGSFVAGIYESEQGTSYNELIKVPDWTRIQIFIDDNIVDIFEDETLSHFRMLDTKHGISIREWRTKDSLGRITYIKFIKFISLANKHELYKEIIIKPENYSAKIRVKSGIDANMPDYVDIAHDKADSPKYINLTITTQGSKKNVSMTQRSLVNIENYTYHNGFNENIVSEEWEWDGFCQNSYRITSIVSVYSSMDGYDSTEKSKEHLQNFSPEFVNKVLDNHMNEWENVWGNCHIDIANKTNIQKYVNFALYHLIKAGKFSGNLTSIPARGLTGESYKGHIFWDTEIYLIPFYTFTQPQIAKALLKYRYNTLMGALENGRRQGRKGADYPWESTDTGLEMTPDMVILPNGEMLHLYAGNYENHISQDIAYAVWQYWIVTQDVEFLLTYGAEIIFETARFSMCLLFLKNDGLYHTSGLEGPDEYHERVDDNAYTNMMIAFNLEIAIKVAEYYSQKDKVRYESLREKIDLSDKELQEWTAAKDKVFVPYDKDKDIYEQFDGYFNLEYVNVNAFSPRTAPLDIILGHEKTKKTQVIKQPDVLMFLFLLANKFSRETVKRNYNFYDPRTGHGSSLSPGIHSIIAARLGYIEQAYCYFLQNAEIDLGNNMGNAAGGVHVAAMGALWMTLIMGFSGMYIYEEGLLFDPHIPKIFEKISFQLIWRGQKLNFCITENEIVVENNGNNPVKLSTGFDNWVDVHPGLKYKSIKKEKWEWTNEKE